MEPNKPSPEAQAKEGTPPKQECLKGMCPYCLSGIDVHLDIKHRPYWRCWRCEVRLFGTNTAMKSLQATGWIWSGERPLDAVKAWLTKIVKDLGLKSKKEK